MKILSPYSSTLNPIEEAFSAWKASVKNELAAAEVTSRINDRTAAAAMLYNLLDYCRGILEQIGNSTLSVVNQKKI